MYLLLLVAFAGGQEDFYELLNACAEGNVATVSRLVAAGVDATRTTPDGETPLHVAGISGNADVVRALVAAGANLEARVWAAKGLRMTPLTWFVYGAHAEGVGALIDAGADVNVIVDDEQGTRITPYDIALKVNADDVLAILQAAGARRYQDLSSHAASM